MKLPRFEIELNLDIFYEIQLGDSPIAASKSKMLKVGYPKHAEFRDYVRQLFDDRNKFKLLGFSPSTIAIEDKSRLTQPIPMDTPMVNPYDDTYRNLVDKYLEIPPKSASFYIVSEVLNDQHVPVCEWVIRLRISNHVNSKKSTDKLGSNSTYIAQKYGKDRVRLIPIDFMLTYSIKQPYPYTPNNKHYDLNIVTNGVNLNGKYINLTFDEAKDVATEYIESVRMACINGDLSSLLGECGESIDATTFTTYNTVEVDSILCDIMKSIMQWKQDYAKYGDLSYADYIWECISYSVEDGTLATIEIADNYGSNFIIPCGIDISEYFSDFTYQQDSLEEVCIVLFESYDWWNN